MNNAQIKEYRLSYGNGQVSETFGSLSAAKKAFASQVEFDLVCKASSGSLRIQRYYPQECEWAVVSRGLHEMYERAAFAPYG